MKNEKKAVALKYDTKTQKAPKVIAKGKGKIANNIINIAKEKGVPIKEDKDLVEMLSQIELNREIPPKLYKAVAEIFSFLHRLTN